MFDFITVTYLCHDVTCAGLLLLLLAVSVNGIAMSTRMIAVAASVFTNNAFLNNHVIVWLCCSALVCICCHIGYLLLHV